MEVTDWKQVLDQALEESVRAAEDKLSNHPAVQDWLHEAAFEAAVGLQGGHDRTGMETYQRLSEGIQEQFPNLVTAVAESTRECGQVSLDWQPGSPEATRIRIDFGEEFPVQAFGKIDELSVEHVNQFLTRVIKHLPKGAPYPRKPHRIAAVLVVEKNRCVTLRLAEVLTPNNERVRFVTIYRDKQIQAEKVLLQKAAPKIIEALQE